MSRASDREGSCGSVGEMNDHGFANVNVESRTVRNIIQQSTHYVRDLSWLSARPGPRSGGFLS